MTLKRSLGPWQAVSLVVGTMIGTGVFLKAAPMAQQLGSMSMVLAAWITAGLLSYCGALTYAELFSRLPGSGGEYLLLREVYGRLPAFLYGWARFWVMGSGSIAAFGVGAATFLGGVLPLESVPGGAKSIAVFLIILFSTINCFELRHGARVQAFLTALKIFLILGFIFAVIWVAYIRQTPLDLPVLSANAVRGEGWHTILSAFGLSMISALWAYEGWTNLALVGDEIRDPKRTIPIGLSVGVLLVTLLYAGANWSYFQVLTLDQVKSGSSSLHPDALPVATIAAQSFLGRFGVPLLSIAFVISALGAMSGSILTNARLPFAMAQDGLAWKKLAEISKKSSVPIYAVIVQAMWSIILAVSGTFDQLSDAVVVVAWGFFILVTMSLFRLRKITPKPSFLVPLFPWIPLTFIAGATFLVLNSVLSHPSDAIKGLVLLGLGLPVYKMLQR